MNTFNSWFCNRIAVFVFFMGLLSIAACSKDEGVAPDKNLPPEIVFAVDALAVRKESDVTLKVNATDPDGDNVTVNWQVRRNGQPSGSLNAAQQGNPSITWVTPTTTGRDTITITATDGKGGTATLVETIRVGTLKDLAIQTANVTWNATDSPFIIRPAQDRFIIEPTASLIVGAGSELFLDKADLEIYVEGTLRTNGTSQAPVIVRPNTRTPEPGDWLGITASPNSSVPLIQLAHTDVLYAKEAIKAFVRAEVQLEGCRVMFSTDFAVLYQALGDLRVLNSAITNNVKSGIRVGGPAVSTLPDSVLIWGDSLAVNGDISGQTPYTDQAAIYIDIPDYSRDSEIQILDNKISRNGFPGIQLARACYPKIHSNSIFSNELGKAGQRYNIRLDNNFGVGGPQDTIGAQQNYWGAPFTNPATDSLLIKQMIRDSEDGVGGIMVRLLIYPWLSAAP
jgi:hypothetical protein